MQCHIYGWRLDSPYHAVGKQVPQTYSAVGDPATLLRRTLLIAMQCMQWRTVREVAPLPQDWKKRWNLPKPSSVQSSDGFHHADVHGGLHAWGFTHEGSSTRVSLMDGCMHGGCTHEGSCMRVSRMEGCMHPVSYMRVTRMGVRNENSRMMVNSRFTYFRNCFADRGSGTFTWSWQSPAPSAIPLLLLSSRFWNFCFMRPGAWEMEGVSTRRYLLFPKLEKETGCARWRQCLFTRGSCADLCGQSCSKHKGLKRSQTTKRGDDIDMGLSSGSPLWHASLGRNKADSGRPYFRTCARTWRVSVSTHVRTLTRPSTCTHTSVHSYVTRPSTRTLTRTLGRTHVRHHVHVTRRTLSKITTFYETSKKAKQWS